MLAHRDMEKMAWILIDHKGDDNIKLLPAEKLSTRPLFLPKNGLHVVRPKMGREHRQDLEELLERIFKHGKIGVYVDEGHLLGPSDAVRTILVAGRSKKVPLMWTSQKANWIDSFVWSQSTFYRVFKLQTARDVKAVQDNWPTRFEMPRDYRSRYFDGTTGNTFHLAPSDPIDRTVEKLDAKLLHVFRSI